MFEAISAPMTVGAADRVGVGDVLRILRRRKAIILSTVIVTLGLTILWLARTPPIYTATASLLVSSESSNLAQPNGMSVTALDELRIATVMELLTSKRLALKVIDELDLTEDPEFAAPRIPEPPTGLRALVNRLLTGEKPRNYGADFDAGDVREVEEDIWLNSIAERLMQRVTVDRASGSNLIEISVSVNDPLKALRIANAFAHFHIEGQIKERRDSTEASIVRLNEHVAELRQRLLEADRAIAAYKRSRNLPAGSDTQTTAADLSRLGSQLADARAQRVEAEMRYRSVRGEDAPSSGVTAGIAPLLTMLRSREAELKAKIAQLSTHYGSGHPDMMAAASELRDVQRRIADEVSRIGKDMRNTIAVQAAREGQIATDLGATRAQAFRQSSESVGLMELERDAETTRSLYLAELARLKEFEARKGDAGADASIASPAAFPTRPSFPRPKLVIAVATVGSLLLGLILASVAHMSDQRVRTADQIESLLGLRTLAMLPMLHTDGDPLHKEVLDCPGSTYAEAVGGLFLDLSSTCSPSPQIIVVTSALPGEGKTTIALSLAAAAVSVGHSAVTVDLDLRRPGVLEALGLPHGSPGILDYLAGEAGVDDIIVQDAHRPGFASISTDRTSENPGAELLSPRLADLLKELRRRFSVIVLNAPPILPVRDAKTLALLADATLFVVPWGASPSALRPAVRMLKGKITGAVLNKVDYNKHASHAYGDAIQHYRKYSMYYLSDDKRRRATRKPKPDVEAAQVSSRPAEHAE